MTSETTQVASAPPRLPVLASPVDRTAAASDRLVAEGGVLASQNAQQITKMVAKL